MCRVRRLHGPALVGQAAVFSHYIEDCSWRMHTGGGLGRPKVLAGNLWLAPQA